MPQRSNHSPHRSKAVARAGLQPFQFMLFSGLAGGEIRFRMGCKAPPCDDAAFAMRSDCLAKGLIEMRERDETSGHSNQRIRPLLSRSSGVLEIRDNFDGDT